RDGHVTGVQTCALPISWIMVPSGPPTEETINKAASLLSAGDIIIDGGNTNFHDDVRRAAELKKKGIHYVDAGTSGGIWGLKLGRSEERRVGKECRARVV